MTKDRCPVILHVVLTLDENCKFYSNFTYINGSVEVNTALAFEQ